MAQQLSFAGDIGPLFSDRDPVDEIRLRPGFVRGRADARGGDLRVASGQMPCDGGRTDEDRAAFRSWLDAGPLP